MARITHKRKRSNYVARPFKRRRTTRFKRRGPSITANYKSISTRGTLVGFKTRRTSRRTYRNHLWNSTKFLTHYRSIHGSNTTLTTTASNLVGPVVLLNLIRYGTNEFWTVAGGLQPHDFGVTTAIFNADIILRGGRWNLEFHNSSGSVDIKVRVFLLNSVTNPNFAFEPTTAPIQWDPSASPDFINFIGKPFRTYETIIESGQNWNIGGMLRIQKIDEITYANQGRAPIAVVHVLNVGQAVVSNLVVTRSYNLSFSGDTH